ncbi:MAG: hypothetical protein WB801_10415, partial [Candidatus Dormiibacterota bacterium]
LGQRVTSHWCRLLRSLMREPGLLHGNWREEHARGSWSCDLARSCGMAIHDVTSSLARLANG